MSEPQLLDLYGGGCGAAEGYRRAGFKVTIVDQVERKERPEGIAFIKADVRDILKDIDFLRYYDAVTASPPCKVHTRLGSLIEAQGKQPIHGDLVGVTRDALLEAGVPYIIENVEGAPLRPDVLLCGSMFEGLEVTDPETGERRWLKRHRLFELGGWGQYGFGIQPECDHPATRPLGVYGSPGDHIPDGGQCARTLAEARELMGMPWATWSSITQAIPPAYTEYLGRHLMAHLESLWEGIA